MTTSIPEPDLEETDAWNPGDWEAAKPAATPKHLVQAIDPVTGSEAPLPEVAIEAEVSVLGAVILDSEAAPRILGALRAEHLTHPGRRELLEIMRAAHERHGAIGAEAIFPEVRRSTIPDALVTLSRVLEETTSANWRLNLELVVSSWERRRERELQENLAAAPIHAQNSAIAALRDHRESVDRRRAVADRPPSHASTVRDVVSRAENGTVVAPRRSTGIWNLDQVSGGLPAVGMTVVAGRPGMGKSCFATSIIPHIVAGDPSRPVVFFSIEMDRGELTENLLASDVGIDRDRLWPPDGKPADLAEWETGKLWTSGNRVAAFPLVVIDDPVQTPGSMRRHILRELEERGASAPSMIVVDYLQKVSIDPGALPNNATREREVAWVSEQLRVISRDFACPLVAVAQLNRGVEGRNDQRPRLADLRESGTLEQDAHLVLGLYRPGYYDEDAELDDDEIIVLKNRRGRIGTARTRFHGGHARWTDPATGVRP